MRKNFDFDRFENESPEKTLIAVRAFANENNITFAEALSQLNTMRGGEKGFKGFVGEVLEAQKATSAGRVTSVVNDNGPFDLIFEGKNGHKYPQQLKIGYKPGQIDFSKYQGQTVIVDKGNPYFKQLRAQGRRCGVKVIEGSVTNSEAKTWAKAMQLECKVTGSKNAYLVPTHMTACEFAKSGALYGAGFSIGKNIVGMMKGDVTAGEAIGNVAIDTAVSGAVGYGAGVVSTGVRMAGSALGRTAAGAAISSAAGTVGTAIGGTAVGSAVVSGASAITGAAAATSAAIGGAAASATAAGLGAVGLAGTAVGAAAIAAAPVVAVGAVIGGAFSLLGSIFGDD